MWLGLSPRSPTADPTCGYASEIVEANGQLTRRYVANGPHCPAMWIARGTEQAPGMLGGHLFGPGGDYHSRILDRWAANPGRRKGAMVGPERRPLILRSSFSCAQPTEDGFSGAQCTSIQTVGKQAMRTVSRDVRPDARLSSTKCLI
jgi:hypothetical protein